MIRLKKIAFVAIAGFALAGTALAYTSPGKPVGFVNDFAGIFAPEQESALAARLAALEKSNSVEIAVATVPSLGGDPVESYASRLFEEWGIGKKGSDDGLLILVAPNEHQVRIEVGYGLEPTVTDAAASVIIRQVMTPAFREGKYFDGVSGAVDEIIGLIQNDPETARFIADNSSSAPRDASNYFYIFFVALAVGINLLRIMARTKSWWLGGVVGLVVGAIFAGITGALVCAAIGLGTDYALSRWAGSWFKGPPGPRGPWFWGGGGRGGGGFGGFGGGSSGGGGASGSW